MSLELLKERFGHSGVTKEVDNREKIHEKLSTRFTYKKDADNEEKIHEKLNAQFNDMGDFKNIKVQHQEQLDEKQRIIENFKIETSELANEIATLKKDKAVLLDNLNKSKWMEDKVHSTAKQIYEDKIKTMSYIDSTELIPLLISVSREKQGNTRLNWGNWLKISENRYLFQINESIAKKVFEGTNVLIERAVGLINRKRTRGGDEPSAKFDNYSLTFDGVATYVTTDFNPDTYSLNEGFTVSYWVRPDAIGATRHALGRRAGSSDERFFFGIHNTRISIGVGSNATNDASVTHTMEVGNWYHWVITYQGNSSGRARKIYMDGELLYTATVAWGTTGNTEGGENIYFGGRNNNGNFVKPWACGLNEVSIFDEEKDSDWVSSAYNGGKPNDLQNESGLVGYWRLENNTEDLSGNGNHGTLSSTDESTYGLPTFSNDVPG